MSTENLDSLQTLIDKISARLEKLKGVDMTKESIENTEKRLLLVIDELADHVYWLAYGRASEAIRREKVADLVKTIGATLDDKLLD